MNTILQVLLLCLFPFTTFATAMKSQVEAHVLRLKPNEDPRASLIKYVKENKITAASIASAVGSLKMAALRYANNKEVVMLMGFREVTSLSGTVSSEGGAHLHLSIADSKGETLGGHLAEGSKVYTTLEIVLLSYPELDFKRKLDPQTTFQELDINVKAKN
jgi:predicted DNA-binding protein with PD1-like motif